ncbi:efflux RND transporter permease subunit [Desulfurivibrio alkaliphilus]|uniref:Acriflavin resistance protein n=1 Tax=Desulfurivibrio alkaliphilus (strain DSM 19089 / UNIQEM U267 / AHT2) TaxID=589865 RepID=D6Z0R4_DESAT|nr:efflux RND transporter permease subunit [Desulfurivibrio alkaliphilus]ADH85293.1 acriflavin resistance protein [Desulfurivibrio alkaliphilus AHT 2]
MKPGVLDKLHSRPRITLAAVVLVALIGMLAGSQMPRQEDPTLRDYWGQILVEFPGADAETVERLVTDVYEQYLQEVEQVSRLYSTSRAELAVLNLELADGTRDIEQAWDDVRLALERAEPRLPSGVARPQLNRDLNEQDSVVLAVAGDNDLLVLRQAARQLQRRLLQLPEVGKVHLVGDPGEQITITWDEEAVRRLGLDGRQLAALLAARNRVQGGGDLAVADSRLMLRPLSEFQSVAEIKQTPLLLPSGGTLPLAELAEVRHGPARPAETLMRLDGRPVVGLGVVPVSGGNIMAFGEAVRELVAAGAPEFAPLEIREMAFQPDWVRLRLSQLATSLLLGIVIVATVLIIALGRRPGLVVAAVVPMVTLTALGIYALGGGVLHQISIAALVIALGMLVDNAIVVTENIQTRLDEGKPPALAMRSAVREVAAPLAAATGTTLAAFTPMLIAQGPTADFTRSIPLVIILTLGLSYLFAILVTPLLCYYFLRPRAVAGGAGRQWRRLADGLGRVAVSRPRPVLAGAALLILVMIVLTPWVARQFFPESDRNQFTVVIKLPEGSRLEATSAAAGRLERELLALPEVAAVATFVGRSAPPFYYNLPRIPRSPNLAQLAVTAAAPGSPDQLVAWTREWARQQLPGTEVVVRKLEQGPPVIAPIEIRLFGTAPVEVTRRLDTANGPGRPGAYGQPALAELENAALQVMAQLNQIPGVRDLRHELSTGAPTKVFAVDDAAAARHGLSREDVALSLYGLSRGIAAGQFRGGDEPVPILVRSPEGEDYPAADLENILLLTERSGRPVPVPLSLVATAELQWRPAAIERQDRRRVAKVLAQLADGTTYSQVLDELRPRLEKLTLPEGVYWELGGDLEGTGEANAAMAAAAPLGLLLLLAILLLQFNSFRKVGIVLVTVPLAAAGVVPGLLLGGQPFGFMSLLGTIALVGVVVNNAIVLLAVAEQRQAAGLPTAAALQVAVSRRARPILLTTATTIAGMLPLAFSPSSLWPPLAWALISGLAASTMLTLLVVPALYLLLCKR